MEPYVNPGPFVPLRITPTRQGFISGVHVLKVLALPSQGIPGLDPKEPEDQRLVKQIFGFCVAGSRFALRNALPKLIALGSAEGKGYPICPVDSLPWVWGRYLEYQVWNK